MLLKMMKGKIHRAVVTEANLNYVGSITIDKTLLDASGILPGECVQIVNINTGDRFETYVIEGETDSGTVCINGGAARLAQADDLVIIIAYGWMEQAEAAHFKSHVVFVNDRNQIVEA